MEPDTPFASSTIEELFERTYASEKNLGLTLFMASSRTHEIGIRKVFGSSGRSIVYSFLRSYFILVLAAALLSVPPTIFLTVRWLDNFPYRTGISWWVFVIAFLIATVVVLSTVSIHAIKASRINPVDALRYE